MKAILALDIGSTIGWSLRMPDGTVEYGEVNLYGVRPVKLAQLANWMRDFMHFHTVDVVVYERPFGRGQAATRMGWGMAGVIEAMATLNEAAVIDVHNASVKKFAAKRGGAAKDYMLAACWAWGFDPQGEHAADAVCVLHYTEATMEVSHE